MAFCELSEDLYVIDMADGESTVSVKLEQGGVGGPVLADVAADLTYRDMGVWFIEVPAEQTAEWPLDVIAVVAEYQPPTGALIRETKALIHPYRSR